MKKTTWVFGSMIAAGAVLLAVPQVYAQGAPQMQGGRPPAGFGQGAPAGFGQGAPGGFGGGAPAGFGQGAPAGFGQGAPGAGRAATGAQNGSRTNSNAKAGTATTTKTATGAKSEKAIAEASKYQLSIQRTDMIKNIVDGYATSEDLSGKSTVSKITDDVAKLMPLIPSAPLEKVDLQALNEQAKKIVEQEYGADDKKYTEIVEAEAAAEFPLYKVGDKVTVNYNMGPKYFSVTGILYRVTENAITVEDKVINLVDLSDEIRSRFDPQKNKYMRARYVETHVHLLNRIKIEKIQDNYDKLKAEIFKHNETAGYIYDPTTDLWKTAQEVAKSYIDRRQREKSRQNRTKTNTKPDQNDSGDEPFDETGETINEDELEEIVADVKPAGGSGSSSASTRPAVVAVNDAIKLENTAESRATYAEVIARAEERKKEANENYAGIDADCGYKNACWNFTIPDTRFALWREPEFPLIKPAIGRDTIDFTSGDDTDIGFPIPADTIDLVYVSNGLSKVVYMMRDCSRQDFLLFKDALTEQYGHAAEDKGAAFTNIFNGKTKPQQIADPAEVEQAQAELKDAEKAFNAAESALRDASDDDRDELQAKRDDAADALRAAVAKVDGFENTVSGESLPYVYSRIKLASDDSGTILPFTFNWKGQHVTGTLVFYYDKGKDKVTSLVFAKEFKK